MEKVRAAATVPWQAAVEFTAEAFAATGVPQPDARKAAEALVEVAFPGCHKAKSPKNPRYQAIVAESPSSSSNRGAQPSTERAFVAHRL